jgi:hypothetical protein
VVPPDLGPDGPGSALPQEVRLVLGPWSPTRRRGAALLGGAALLALVATAAWSHRSASPMVSETAWRDAPLARPSTDAQRVDEGVGGVRGAAPGAPAVPAAVPAPIRRPPPPLPPPERLFGGRPVDWWTARLDQLRRRGGQAQTPLYEATIHVAQANGLVVAEAGDAVAVSLPAQPATDQERR